MGREQIEALLEILQEQLKPAGDFLALGTWTIRFDKERDAFYFDKCEFDGYCEEKPVVFSRTGEILDRGGPLF